MAVTAAWYQQICFLSISLQGREAHASVTIINLGISSTGRWPLVEDNAPRLNTNTFSAQPVASQCQNPHSIILLPMTPPCHQPTMTRSLLLQDSVPDCVSRFAQFHNLHMKPVEGQRRPLSIAILFMEQRISSILPRCLYIETMISGLGPAREDVHWSTHQT